MTYPLVLKRLQIEGELIEIFVPEEAMMQKLYQQGKIAFPYWSKLWPSAIALTKFLLRYPEYIQDKSTLELAAGLGLPSLVIAKKAAHSICSDYDADAVTAIQKSIELNRFQNVETKRLDWRLVPPDLSTDVLLLSDVNYDPQLFEQQLAVINRFLRAGSTVILATPQRLMAKDFIAALLDHVFDKQEIAVKENGVEVLISVFVLKA